MQTDGEKVETVADFIFVGSRITKDGDYSHKLNKMLDPWKKSYDKPIQWVKSRDITLLRRSIQLKLWFFQ